MSEQIARKGALGFIVSISVAFFGLFSLIVIKRYMGFEVVGIIAFATAYTGLFSIISDMGFGSTHLKKLNEKEMDESECNGVLLTVKSILNIVMVSVVLLSIFIQKYVIPNNGISQITEIVLYLSIVRVFFDNFNSISKNIFSSYLARAKIMIPKLIGRFIQMIIKVYVAYFGLRLELIVIAEIIAAIFILFMYIYLIRVYKFKYPSWEYVKIYWKFAIPLIFLGILLNLSQNIDKVMLQYFLGSKSVGIYVVPQRLIMFFVLMSATFTTLLLPLYSKFYSQGDYSRINSLSQRSIKFISMTILPLLLCIFLFSDSIMSLIFGSDTNKSADVLRLLTITTYLNAIALPSSVQLVSTGHLKLSTMMNMLTLLLNLGLNLLLIPSSFLGYNLMGYGVQGAAISTIICFIFRFIFVSYYSYRITQTKVYSGLLKHVFSALVTYLILNEVLVDSYILLPVNMFVSVIFYFFILFLLREFGKTEMELYIRTLGLKNMKKYIMSEMRESKHDK